MHTLPKENVDSTKLGIPTKKKALQKKKKRHYKEWKTSTDWTDISNTYNWQSLLPGICKE